MELWTLKNLMFIYDLSILGVRILIFVVYFQTGEKSYGERQDESGGVEPYDGLQPVLRPPGL